MGRKQSVRRKKGRETKKRMGGKRKKTRRRVGREKKLQSSRRNKLSSVKPLRQRSMKVLMMMRLIMKRRLVRNQKETCLVAVRKEKLSLEVKDLIKRSLVKVKHSKDGIEVEGRKREGIKSLVEEERKGEIKRRKKEKCFRAAEGGEGGQGRETQSQEKG